jgi:hypothetical protein
MTSTDGSRCLVNNKALQTGSAYFITRGEDIVTRGKIGLGWKAGVFDAEMMALARAAMVAQSYIQRLNASNITLKINQLYR